MTFDNIREQNFLPLNWQRATSIKFVFALPLASKHSGFAYEVLGAQKS